MNKPIIAALAGFSGWSGITLAISYFKHGEAEWLTGVGGGLVFALALYAVAQRQQQKVNSSSESDDS